MRERAVARLELVTRGTARVLRASPRGLGLEDSSLSPFRPPRASSSVLYSVVVDSIYSTWEGW